MECPLTYFARRVRSGPAKQKDFVDYSRADGFLMPQNCLATFTRRENRMMRAGATAGSRRARSVKSAVLSSCAVLGLAGMMLVAAPVAGPGPARAQFGAGLPLSFGKPTEARYHHRRRYRYYSRYRRRGGPQDDGPDTEVERPAATGPAAEPGPRPSAAPTEPRPPSRPQRRGLDTTPEK